MALYTKHLALTSNLLVSFLSHVNKNIIHSFIHSFVCFLLRHREITTTASVVYERDLIECALLAHDLGLQLLNPTHQLVHLVFLLLLQRLLQLALLLPQLNDAQ